MSEVQAPTVPLDRGQRIWARLLSRRAAEPVSLERARLITESYRETEGLSVPLRRAKGFARITAEIPIYIDDEQLLVGDFAARPMAGELFPEHTVSWVLAEIKSGHLPYKVPPSEIGLLQDISSYWQDRAVRESFIRNTSPDELALLKDLSDEGAWIFPFFLELQNDKGWYVPNFPSVIQKGLLAILQEVEAELKATEALDEASFEKRVFLQALKTVIPAAINYAARYAALARQQAGQASPGRAAELIRIAETCERVPAYPARNFHEALQAMWFCQVLIFWDTKGTGVSPGRVDQYLYPYFSRDIAEGRLTREEAIELLECLRCKYSAMRQFESAYKREAASGEAQFFNCTLGGQTADGKDAANDLSYLWLEAAMRVQSPHPTLSIRWHRGISREFALKAVELCAKGLGFPAWFGDDASIQYLLWQKATLEEARDYAVAGCVLHVVPNKTAASWPLVLNLPKLLEMTLHNGTDPASGKRIGPRTGSFAELTTYEDLVAAYREQVRCFNDIGARYVNRMRLFRSRLVPQMFCSLLIDDCIKRGQNPLGGGARYENIYLHPVGTIDVVDSLAAIKKYVYDDAKVSQPDLLAALAANFVGHESLRRTLLAAPKFGNDDDFADNIARDLFSWLAALCDRTDAPFGAKYVNSPHSVSWHGPCGKRVGALPSGRPAGTALADGGISPEQGADLRGPTAIYNSAGKIDQVPLFGTLLNVKFHPTALKSVADRVKFLDSIKTYLEDLGGKHVQFNIVSKETLLDAQRNPELYRGLVVRVAGYSAFWVELSQSIQNEIIGRTEHAGL